METKIISKSIITIFFYKGATYSYLWESSSVHGFGYIKKGSDVIYGPYEYQCTHEGREIYEVFRKENL